MTFRQLRLCLVALAAILAPVLARAQIAYSSPKGRVEILGLRRWTLQMLQDSLKRYDPKHALHDAACMVTLRDKLHFAEAGVTIHILKNPDGTERQLLSISVVEPEEAARVQWDTHARSEFSSLLPAYAPIILPISDSLGQVEYGRVRFWLQFRDSSTKQSFVQRGSARERADAERLATFLAGLRGERQQAAAIKILDENGFWINQLVAAAILSNFPTSDSSRWALVRAMRSPNEAVRTTANAVLRSFPVRAVDWSPVAPDLRLLLGGTNVIDVGVVIQMLAATQVSANLAPALLHDNAEWVLDHLASELTDASDAAHSLLVLLNHGKDLGRERKVWAAWASKL